MTPCIAIIIEMIIISFLKITLFKDHMHGTKHGDHIVTHGYQFFYWMITLSYRII